MSRGWLLLLLIALVLPCQAARSVTIEQVDQFIAANHGRSDDHLAQEITKLELTERASATKLAVWQNALGGPKTRIAFTSLADASAFLAPPAAEIPNLPIPDHATQVRLYTSIAVYINDIIPKLPNFIADRVTTRFEDDLPIVDRAPFSEELLHVVGSSTARVIYRDHNEVVDPDMRKRAEYKRNALKTVGEFGPILVTVLLDSAKGQVFWDHWEQGSAGPIAIFRYTVPQRFSHYSVTSIPHAVPAQTNPPYHGQISVNPADGSILRLTMVAEMDPADHVTVAAVAVDYGPVSIGGKTYYCPIKSVAISKLRREPLSVIIPNQLPAGPPPVTHINHVEFQNYHLFRGETRILSDDDPQLKVH